ncbi:hypothetical protein [Desulforamulus hydrothermalis]|nr:hypothetical protein [Desulforamulus hydrothermalis]
MQRKCRAPFREYHHDAALMFCNIGCAAAKTVTTEPGRGKSKIG